MLPNEEDSKQPEGTMKDNDGRIVDSAPGDVVSATATAAATATLPLMSSASSCNSAAAAAEAATIRDSAAVHGHNHRLYASFLASVPQHQQNTNIPHGATAAASPAATSSAKEAAACYKKIMSLVARGRLDQHQHQLLQQLVREQQQQQQQQQPLQEDQRQMAALSPATENPLVVPLVHPKVSVNLKKAPETLQTPTKEATAMNTPTAGKASATAAVASHKRKISSTTLPQSLSAASSPSSPSSPLSNSASKKRLAVTMKTKHRPLPLMRPQLLQSQHQPISKISDNNNKSNGFAPSIRPQSFTTQKKPSTISTPSKDRTNNNDSKRNSRSSSPPQTKRRKGESLPPETEQERPQKHQNKSSSLSSVHTNATNGPQHGARRPGFAARTLEQLQDVTQHWFTHAFRQQQQHPSGHSSGRSSSSAIATTEENASSTSTRMFTLYFNESSVQAVAYWTNYYNLRNKSNGTENMNGFLIPTVDVRYRMCGTCYLYGHYELECPSLPRDLTLRFAKDLQTAIRTQQGQELRKKQLQQQQSTQQPDGDGAEMLDNDAEKHREIPYHVAVENCDGYLIEQRAESELDVTEVDDGVVIQAAASAEAFLGVGEPHGWNGENTPLPHEQSQKLNRGDLVAWLLPPEPADTVNGIENLASGGDTLTHLADVCVGVVKHESPRSPNQILVKVVHIIPREQIADSSKFPRDVGPPMDSCVWVERGAVHLVVEPTRVLQSRRTVLLGKRKTGWFDNKSRHHRAIKQRKDGTFARPAGRPPIGHRWDAATGSWVPEAA